MNSLYQPQNIPQQGQNNNIVDMVKNSKNPAELFQNMAQSNPQVRSIMDMIKQTNQTPKQMFYNMAQQKGIDPNQIIGMFR